MEKGQRSGVRDQRSGLPSIFDRQSAITSEFEEPLRDVVSGFVPLGMTLPSTAEALGVDPRSLRKFCNETSIRFPRNQPDRAERIRDTMRRGSRARILSLGRRRQCLAEWAEEYGMNADTLRKRLARGYDLRTALAL